MRRRAHDLPTVRLVGRRTGSDDEGMALVLVIGSMLILASLLLVTLAYATRSTALSRFDQDYAAAMSAAQAGVDDFVSRLNRDDDYGDEPDCTNPAMQNPTDCPADGYGWMPVTPGETDAEAPYFHYEIDASRALLDGTIMVVATGRVNDVYRTIEVAVGKGGSTDYVYYTDFESADPDNRVAYPNGTTRAACGANGPTNGSYFWQGRSGCSEIQFGPNDVLDGRTFSNDSILSVGGRFIQGIESANPGCQTVNPSNRNTWDDCLRSGSSFTATGNSETFGAAPQYATLLRLQDNSSAFVNVPGCHYYGATRIVFRADGTMKVWSKDSNFTGAVTSVPDDDGVEPSCGTGAALASAAGATVAVPSDMVIYVQSAPTSGPGAVVRRMLDAGEIDGTLPLGTYNRTANGGSHATTGNPAAGSGSPSYRYDVSMTDTRKYSGEGNVYIQGSVKGRVTIAAAQSIVLTGDLVVAGGLTGSDIVGLVATNSVEVMHPRLHFYEWTNCTKLNAYDQCSTRGSWAYRDLFGNSWAQYPSDTWPQRIPDASGVVFPTAGLQVDASIQTLQHSFFVQQYDNGRGRTANGDIALRGSLAQRYRGAVGTAGSPGTGYNKDYKYDVRLRYTAPPYFPHWVNAQWTLRYSGEVDTVPELKQP